MAGKFTKINRKMILHYFFSYWKKLFFFFALPLMLIIVFVSYYENVRNTLREENHRSQEFFEVYHSFNNVFEEISDNYSNLILQGDFEQYVSDFEGDDENGIAASKIRSLFSNSTVSMQYLDAVHFLSLEKGYVVSTKNGNYIEDFLYTKFYENYLKTGKSTGITYEKKNREKAAPEAINICCGLFKGSKVRGMVVYSINPQSLLSEIFSGTENLPYNIMLTDNDEFYYFSSKGEDDGQYYKKLAAEIPYSDENNFNYKILDNSYAYKVEQPIWSVTMMFTGESVEYKGIFSIWFVLFMLLFINLTVVAVSFVLTRQFRQQLISITQEFMQQFSLEGSVDSDYLTMNQSIFDNLKTDEKPEIAFPRQVLNLKKAQLHSLQMQLSPHFMYNTLNSINLMVMNLTKSDNDISRLIMLLSELLYDVLDTKQYIITLKKEIEYSKKFLEIENIKRKNSVEITWDVEKELLGCGVIKFIIQPVLENIFRHAFRSLQEEKKVSISIAGCEKGFCISVKDNGMGIAKEKLDEITRALNGEDFKERHIGLVNVNRRIQMLYGADYGLKISSVLSEGTTVEIVLPKISKESK